MAMLRTGSLTADAVDRLHRNLYRELSFDPLYRPLVAKTMLRVVTSNDRLQLHCAAGKDGTGIMCLLLMHVLGVPKRLLLTIICGRPMRQGYWG